MYIIENNRVLEVECNQLGIRTGMDLSKWAWIDSKLIESGIFRYNNQVYYKHEKVANFINDNKELSKLYSSYNVVDFIQKKVLFYKKVKDFIMGSNNLDIIDRHESIKLLITENIEFLDFFINYSESLLENKHINYCANIKIKSDIIHDLIGTIECKYDPELYFLKDCQMLLLFDSYCDHILTSCNKLCDLIYKLYVE
tara:strand:- start:57 stop:650 length:594 start_codon:yes stop_codon:yes gene_type:complete